MRIPAWVGTLALTVWVLIAFPGVVLMAMNIGPLDRAPYLLCALVGGAAATLLWWISGRWQLGWRDGRARTGVLLGPALLPLVFIELGIGANAYFDRSPPTFVQSRIIRYELKWKGTGVCIVRSWRGRAQEVLNDATFVERRGGQGYVPGSYITVTTRAGALGWEWVERVE